MAVAFQPPKISFIVTCWNKAIFINECLKSIKEQTYLNKEIIVVDDASTDDSVKIVEKFKTDNAELTVKIVKNSINLGQFASFLEGVKVSEGEFVTLTDGDDVLFSDFAAARIKTHLNTVVALTSGRQVEIDEQGTLHCMKSADCPFINLSDFAENVQFDPKMFSSDFANSNFEVKFLDNRRHSFATWHWSPSSSAVLRKATCELLLSINSPSEVQITADKFIFSFAHLIGSSALIDAPLYAYRRHDSNYSKACKVLGNKTYHKKSTQNNYIRNNLLIRKVMWNFITKNKKMFIENFNHAGYINILRKIIFSLDLRTIKSVLKSLWV